MKEKVIVKRLITNLKVSISYAYMLGDDNLIDSFKYIIDSINEKYPVNVGVISE